MKKYILFDHDGVLVDTEYWYYLSTRRAMSELGYDLSLETYQKLMPYGISIRDLAGQSGIDESTILNKREDRNRYYQEYLRKEAIEIPGVENILGQLSGEYRMAIVTTAEQQDFDIIHEDRNLVPFMDFVLTRKDYLHSKPDPEPYLKALERFAGRKEETLIVEDSERGLRSAVAAGIDCVIVHNEFTKSQDFSAASWRISSLAELPGLLKQL